MNARRIRKIFGLIFSLVLILGATLAVMIWYEFPSWTGVRNAITALRPLRPETTVAPSLAPPATTALPPSPQTSAAPTPQAKSIDPDVISYLVDRFISAPSTTEVCENLIDTPNQAPAAGMGFQAALNQRALGNAPENTFLESALIPIGAVVQLPNVGGLIEALRTGDADFTSGPQFNSLLASASADAIAAQTELDRRAQHAYHLYVLSRAVARSPGLAGDVDVQALCSEIEARAMSSAAPADIAALMTEEKAAVLRMLASANIAPEQVGFDPNLQNEVRVTVNSLGIGVRIPWIMRAFGTEFRIRNPALDSASATTQEP